MARRKTKQSEDPGVVLIASNRKASFDYELQQRFEAGLVLVGSEIKAIRHRAVGITDAWVAVHDSEAFIESMRIELLQHAAFGHTKETRSRKLLLHRKEILTLKNSIERDGMTVIVTRLYLRNGKAKVQIAIAKGKKTVDKRNVIKNRDAEREAQAMLRQRTAR